LQYQQLFRDDDQVDGSFALRLYRIKETCILCFIILYGAAFAAVLVLLLAELKGLVYMISLHLRILELWVFLDAHFSGCFFCRVWNISW
jgi:hypothetical protein